MSENLYITGKPGSFNLINRSWYGGHRPDYEFIKHLTDDEAIDLSEAGTFTHLYGCKIKVEVLKRNKEIKETAEAENLWKEATETEGY